MKNLLWIGINGLAGSGKDTVCKMLSFILQYKINDFNSCYDLWKRVGSSTDEMENKNNISDIHCATIAFADQLKKLCSMMFGIPVERFYYNKQNSWVCINKDFRYTEIKPSDNYIVTAEEYWSSDSYKNSSMSYYMSLREVLVYVGTYICQKYINQDIWMNIVSKEASRRVAHNPQLQYMICPDVRFIHEFDFIKQTKHGINIKVVRDSVVALDNIAEHALDDNEEEFDYIIENNGTYEDLFHEVWDFVHDNLVFKNETITLASHDGSHNYLRLESMIGDTYQWKLMCEYGACRVIHSDGKIEAIDPSGGPMLSVGSVLSLEGGLIKDIDISDYCLDWKICEIRYDEYGQAWIETC